MHLNGRVLHVGLKEYSNIYLNHQVLHDAVKGKHMPTWRDLGTQGAGLKGYGALHLTSRQHDHLYTYTTWL